MVRFLSWNITKAGSAPVLLLGEFFLFVGAQIFSVKYFRWNKKNKKNSYDFPWSQKHGLPIIPVTQCVSHSFGMSFDKRSLIVDVYSSVVTHRRHDFAPIL